MEQKASCPVLTHRGYPNLDGYAWYRLRVHVKDPGHPLWLKMPNDFDDAYQVYANGSYVGQFGNFSRGNVTVYSARPFSFPLPPPGPRGEIDLAPALLHDRRHAIAMLVKPAAMALAACIGAGFHRTALQASEDDSNLHYYLGSILQSLLFFHVLPLAFWAWLQNRRWISTYSVSLLA